MLKVVWLVSRGSRLVDRRITANHSSCSSKAQSRLSLGTASISSPVWATLATSKYSQSLWRQEVQTAERNSLLVIREKHLLIRLWCRHPGLNRRVIRERQVGLMEWYLRRSSKQEAWLEALQMATKLSEPPSQVRPWWTFSKDSRQWWTLDRLTTMGLRRL